MKKLTNPPPSSWAELTRRPSVELEFLESSVRNTLNRVRRSGDHALLELTKQFDGISLKSVALSSVDRAAAAGQIGGALKAAIELAASNITRFHEQQNRQDFELETMPGVLCGRRSVPIQRVGIYIPGGSAPLFSTVLMLGIPARLAKCREVILCSPPQADGSVHPAIVFAASLCGITRIFSVGGAQAIAAMAYGTQSIPAVDKIFGPGNQYVTKAKQIVSQERIAIDMPAGPSEVLIITDENSNASYVAADLLSQAEHGNDSQVVLLSSAEPKLLEVLKEVDRQIADLPRKQIAQQALDNSLAITFSSPDALINFANEYAAEHVIINTADCDVIAQRLVNAGSIFLGPYSAEAAGDYASGPNHTLPTAGFARNFSGVTLESFCKTISYQKLTLSGLRAIGPAVEVMAEAENLVAHKRAISIRLSQ